MLSPCIMLSFICTSLCLFAIQVTVLALPAGQDSGIRYQDSVTKHLFAFGDSYTSTTFNVTLEQPNTQDPMGNPALGDGTSAKGINYLGWLTTTYNTSLTYTLNFAHGGATTSQKLSPNDFVSFEDQVGTEFIPRYSGGAYQWDSADSIFSIFMGINDIGSNYVRLGVDQHTMITSTMQFYWKLVEKLYGEGARNFIFINVPPLERSPSILSSGNATPYAEWVAEFNEQLTNNIEKFTVAHPDVQVAPYDFHSFFQRVIDSPSTYGFRDANCEADGIRTCIWADGYHPHSTFHKLWAKDMLPILSNVGW